MMRPRRLPLLAALLLAAAAPPPPPPAPQAGAPRAAYGDYLAASVAMQSNDYVFAAEHMLRALAADPRNRRLREQAFLATALAGRPEAQRLASGLSGNVAAALVLGNGLAAAGHWNEAIRAYGALPHDEAVGDLLRPVLVAWSEYGAGHPELGLQTLQPLLNGNRLPAFYALQAGLLADAAGRMSDAAAAYHVAQTASPGLNLALVRVIASFEARTGHLDDAQALVHALVTGIPSLAIAEAGLDASLTARTVADARQGVARAYLSVASMMTAQSRAESEDGGREGGGHGNASALLMLRFSETLDPGWSETRLVLSDVAQGMGDARGAIAAIEPIRGNDPLFALAQLRIAELRHALGDDAGARAIYEDLVRAYPNQPTPSRELGELLSEEHRYAEAVTAFDRAIAATPHPTADDWSLFFDRAVALDRSHQWNRAEADLRHALSLSPDQPYVLNYLGYSYAEQDRNLDEARRMLERALAQKPHDGAFLDSLGWIILKQGNVPAALDQLQQAAELTPEDPAVNYHLGVAYWMAGRRVEAENQWRRALILNPDPGDLPKIEARLREADASAGARPQP